MISDIFVIVGAMVSIIVLITLWSIHREIHEMLMTLKSLSTSIKHDCVKIIEKTSNVSNMSEELVKTLIKVDPEMIKWRD